MADGELYVCGRTKDLIIRQGRKYHPPDLESAHRRPAGRRASRASWCSAINRIDDADEVVAVLETRAGGRARRRSIEQVRRRVRETAGLELDRVVVTPPGTIPRTTSGKVRRVGDRARAGLDGAGTLVRMSLFDKLEPIARAPRRASRDGAGAVRHRHRRRSSVPPKSIIGGRRTLMCGSNNYFGLSFHPDVIAAAQAAVAREGGSGTTGSRAANGTYAAHRRLEAAFAECVRQARTRMVFTHRLPGEPRASSSGLCGRDDTVLVDIESHASIYDGARLSGAQMFAFRHNSPADLRAQAGAHRDRRRTASSWSKGCIPSAATSAPLARHRGRLPRGWRVPDGGRSALLRRLRRARPRLRRRRRACSTRVDFIVGTFSKSARRHRRLLPSRSHDALRLLHFASRPYVFTASGSPANIAGVEAALRILLADRTLRDRLWDQRPPRPRRAVAHWASRSGRPSRRSCRSRSARPSGRSRMWAALLQAGLYVNIVLPPACRPDACLLRTSYSAAHTPEADRPRARASSSGWVATCAIIEAAA